MSKIILITGASSGFGRLTTEALGRAGHTVYASMRDVAGRNAKNAVCPVPETNGIWTVCHAHISEVGDVELYER